MRPSSRTKKEILEKGDTEISTKYSDPFFNIYVIDVIELIRVAC